MPSSGDIAKACSSSGLRYEACFDPYRALARIGRGADEGLLAVLVDVDALSPKELEFFAQARRLRNGIRLFVLSGRGHAPSVERAIAAGATAELTRACLERLLSEVTEVHGTPSTGPSSVFQHELVSMARREADKFAMSSVDSPACPSIADRDSGFRQGSEEQMPSAGEATDDVGAAAAIDDAAPVRVPWLRYADTPVRGAPLCASPARSDSVAPPKPRSREPLLSAEELRALMEEDWPELPDTSPDAERRALHNEVPP